MTRRIVRFTELFFTILGRYGPQIDKRDHALVSDRVRDLDNFHGIVPLLASHDPAMA